MDIQTALALEFRITRARHMVHKRSRDHQNRQRNADAEKADEGEEFSPLQNGDRDLKIIFQHKIF